MPRAKTRCEWCGTDPLYVAYHDEEWGVPVRDDRTLFEFLLLEGAQAGLAWITILRKREGYRKAYGDFDPVKIARWSDAKIERLLKNPEIVRNRLKVEGARKCARAYLNLVKEEGNFSEWIWQFVGGKPIVNRYRSLKEIPAVTDEAKAMAKALKKRGFTFVGPTICYAFMQAVGMVNDHVVDCYRWKQVQKKKR